MRRVVDDFVAEAAPAPAVDFFRKDVPGFQEWKPSDGQVAHMKPLHTGMKITAAEFSALATHLDAALRAGGGATRASLPPRDRKTSSPGTGSTGRCARLLLPLVRSFLATVACGLPVRSRPCRGAAAPPSHGARHP